MKLKLFHIAGCILSLFPGSLWALQQDTLFIEEVQLVSSRLKHYQADMKQISLDTFLLQSRFSQDLGVALSQIAPVGITSYGGAGSLTTLSVRGTGSAHTTVIWNGLPLNSITSGMADLSLIPAGSFNSVVLTYGTPGALAGSGTFGGTIELNRIPDWNSKTRLKFLTEAGSFHHYAGQIDLETGNKNFRYNLNVFYNNTGNDFYFRDTQKSNEPVERLTHNRLLNQGFMQNFNWKLKNGNYLEAGTWFQTKYKQIPALMGDFGNSLKEQKDSTLKLYVKWKKMAGNKSYSALAGWSSDNLRYIDADTNSLGRYVLDSKILTQQGFIDLNERIYFTRFLSLDIGLNIALLSANVSAYSGKVTEYRANLLGGLKYVKGPLNLSGIVRFHKNPYQVVMPLPSFGAKYTFSDGKTWLRSSVSARYRLPGFNDKYWKPGGNPNLLPEKGWGADMGAGRTIYETTSGTHSIKAEATFFSGLTDNWIQWIPEDGFWSPVNYKKVWSRGLEINLNYDLKYDRFSANIRTGYSYTRSSVLNSGTPQISSMQLRYVPRHILTAQAGAKLKGGFILLNYRYYGKQFTTEDNQEAYAVQPWQTFDLSAGYRFGKTFPGSLLQFRIENLFNEQYQVVRLYPMPGRSFNLSFIFVIN